MKLSLIRGFHAEVSGMRRPQTTSFGVYVVVFEKHPMGYSPFFNILPLKGDL